MTQTFVTAPQSADVHIVYYLASVNINNVSRSGIQHALNIVEVSSIKDTKLLSIFQSSPLLYFIVKTIL